jgi:hypothetical protein
MSGLKVTYNQGAYRNLLSNEMPLDL